MSVHDWLYDISRHVWPYAANHLWQTTLACGLAMVAIFFLNRESARARYAVWVIISLKFALPSAVLVALLGLNGLRLKSFAAQTGPVENSGPIWIGFFDIADLPTNGQPGQTHSEIYCLLTVVWLVGFACVLTRWLRKRAAFSHLLRSSRVIATDRESAALRRVTSWLQARSDIELIVAPEIVEPGVWRIFRPAIVLPESMSAQLSDPELESVLMHEVIHIQRRDNLVASLQMILCSIFWFHPLIWIIDRKMLSDREQACDQEVCLVGGQSAVYAASLLKVLRFCIGFRMAGVSSVVGSNLKRRIEEIMRNEVDKRSARLQRAFVVAVALAVMVFSVAAGLMSRDRIFAEQGSNKHEGVKGGVQGDVPGGVPAGSLRGAGGAMVGASGIAGDGTQDHFRVEIRSLSQNVDEDLKNAAEISLPFDNIDQAPVIITEARMKTVKASSVHKKEGNDLVYWADQYAVNASLTVVNNSSQRVKRVWLVFSCAKAGPVGYPTAHLLMEPGTTIQIEQRQWRGLGDPSSFSVKVGEVLFEGGDRWPEFLPSGTVVTPLPPPPPPIERSRGRSPLLIWLPRQ
jgi:beta-lactamase regulating signal transducer with metallopeptidase domain